MSYLTVTINFGNLHCHTRFLSLIYPSILLYGKVQLTVYDKMQLNVYSKMQLHQSVSCFLTYSSIVSEDHADMMFSYCVVKFLS
jgi:hypothetical protein